MITPAQLRAARGLVRLSAEALAKQSNLSWSTVQRFEAGQNVLPIALQAIREAMERAGVEFTDDGGVRPRKLAREAAE
jgi:transcriptional regulator with XRE-family HTH domain